MHKPLLASDMCWSVNFLRKPIKLLVFASQLIYISALTTIMRSVSNRSFEMDHVVFRNEKVQPATSVLSTRT